MSYYLAELNRIKSIHFANEQQLQRAIAVREFIDIHYNKSIKLECMANDACLSKFHLLRIFKRYYGLTPGQYLIDRRIEESKKYLRAGMTVQQVCFEVGFESPCSFSTLFKKKIGTTPGEFQKRQFSQSEFSA